MKIKIGALESPIFWVGGLGTKGFRDLSRSKLDLKPSTGGDAAFDVVVVSVPALLNMDKDRTERKAREMTELFQMVSSLTCSDSSLSTLVNHELALHCQRCPLSCPVDNMDCIMMLLSSWHSTPTKRPSVSCKHFASPLGLTISLDLFSHSLFLAASYALHTAS